MTKVKKHTCSRRGCGKSFTRSDHLRRHTLNHSMGNSTCERCRLHFKRPDLLERHLARHRQKDDVAGGPGLGLVESRKKLWLDVDGQIVSKRPSTITVSDETTAVLDLQQGSAYDYEDDDCCRNLHNDIQSTSTKPLQSLEISEWYSHEQPRLSCYHVVVDPIPQLGMAEFPANALREAHSSSVENAKTGRFEEMFASDTTTNNQHWLFEPDMNFQMVQGVHKTQEHFNPNHVHVFQQSLMQTTCDFTSKTSCTPAPVFMLEMPLRPASRVSSIPDMQERRSPCFQHSSNPYHPCSPESEEEDEDMDHTHPFSNPVRPFMTVKVLASRNAVAFPGPQPGPAAMIFNYVDVTR